MIDHYYRWPITNIRYHKAVVYHDGSVHVEKWLLGNKQDIEFYTGESKYSGAIAEIITHPKDCPELLAAILVAKSNGKYTEWIHELARDRAETDPINR